MKSLEEAKAQYNLEEYKERDEFINEILANKSIDEIDKFLNDTIKNLIDTPVIERGGLVAITGFYYQMLVVIDYLIEMKQGKWDYIAIELHDDIVAVKDKKIRFIQVKTSNDMRCKISEKPASGVYLRSNKKEKEIGDSWIDKLILKARNFKKDDGFITEFELVTNYTIVDSPRIKIDNYIGGNILKTISSDDSIYERLNKECYTYENNAGRHIKIVYEDICGETLEELLARFYIVSKQNSLNNIEGYLDNLCQRIGREIGGLYVSHKVINLIIGQLFARCNVNVENTSLVITKAELKSIFLEVENIAMSKATQITEENSTEKLVESAYRNIYDEYNENSNYSFIEKIILKYKEYLIDFINKNGGINKFINRYRSGNELSNEYLEVKRSAKELIIQELILIPIILMVIHDKEIQYSEEKSLLTKKIEYPKNGFVSLLGVKKGKLKNKIEEIKLIINSLEIEDILKISMAEDLNIILQGYNDSSFLELHKIEVGNSFECDELLELDTDESIKKVQHIISLIPGNIMKEWLEEQLESDEWNDNEIRIAWENMIRGDE